MHQLTRRNALYGMLVATTFMVLPTSAKAQTEIIEGYPQSYNDIVSEAEKEGSVVIYANTENAAVAPILADFQKKFPKIRLDYIEIKAADLYSRVSSEAAANALKADIVWSSAMDLQYQMVQEGFAAEYTSPETKNIPEWASYGNKLYAVTFEPVVFVYNSRLVSPDEMPKTRLGLAKFLENNADRFKGKVTTYDPQRSGLGFFAVSHDAKINDDLWSLVKAFGTTDTKFYVSTGTMLEKIGAGEHAIAYNIIGPYAYLRAARDQNVKIVVPEDFTLILSRSAYIVKNASHPNAARVFLDYLLSRPGQMVIANEAHLFSIRADVEGEATAARLTTQYGEHLKPVSVNDSLADDLSPVKRMTFFRKWDQVFKAGQR
ncbi:ABC transporter substrate-binding protein [uncultured Bartonella sp.]|uniref:ABC transporter substrate-binding protein n=1 Tax=uncultured Bartonella sp. TaxID=104108 RepID=UPI0026251814|nr:ABC transporter substrate-binding protein [uncultured Bartonella sp.]